MATIKEWLIDYMGNAYKQNNVVEFSPSELRTKFAKANPTKNDSSVHTAIYQLKHDGIVVDLKKSIPGKKGNFITLAKILEKETEPMSKKPTPVNVPAQPTPMVKEEPKKPTPAPINPFDKVTTTLAEILAKVNGLVQGYSELVQKTPNVDVTVDFSEVTQMLSKHESASHHRYQASTERLDILKKVIDSHFQNLQSSPSVHSVEIGGAKVIAEEVNRRLRDVTQEDTLLNDIYHMMSINTSDIISKVAIPKEVTNQDDYRAGLKEGIRLATELSLTIREE